MRLGKHYFFTIILYNLFLIYFILMVTHCNRTRRNPSTQPAEIIISGRRYQTQLKITLFLIWPSTLYGGIAHVTVR